MKYPTLDQSKIKQFNFPDSQYYKEVTDKKQICLHHTASGPGTDGDIHWWLTDPARVATCVIIDRTGIIDSCFDSKYWAHHLGTHALNNHQLNQHCLGIEIDAWGALVFLDGAYRSYTGQPVPVEEVIEYPMGFKTIPNSPYFLKKEVAGEIAHYYHRYTKEQILSVAQLLEYWGPLYNIPLTYNEDMWHLSTLALSGAPGVWTHASYLEEKSDCHPQEQLIYMLKSLTSNPQIV